MSRTANRVTGGALALLMQAAFLALLIFSRTPTIVPEKVAHELTLILPRLPRAEPAPAPARTPQSSRALEAPQPIVPFTPGPAAPLAAPPVSPPDLSRLGQSIFGCAPENYSSLTPEQRALCPRPGEGLVVRTEPDPLHPPKSHVKDEAMWQEQWDEAHWTPLPCPPDGRDPIFCEMEQRMAENNRAKLARQALDQQKAAALRGSPPLLPKTIGVHPQ